MLLPTVHVALPPEATPADTAVLVEACDRAYHAGGCRAITPGATTGDVIAEVRWQSNNEASVAIGLRYWKGNRWIRRELDFEEHDAVAERYRSLGFALGSLAGTVIEVAGLEAEARVASPPPPVIPQRRSAPAPQQPGPGNIPNRFWLGAQAARGLDRVQLGGTFGVGVSFPRGWVFDVSASYTAHAANREGLAARYLSLRLAGGYAFDVGPLDISFTGGPLLYGFSPQLRQSGDSKVRPALGGLAGVRAEVREWSFSPFVGLDAGYVHQTDVSVDEVPRASFGPWHWQMNVGLRFDSNLL